MGIRPNGTFGNDCLACFAPGETPDPVMLVLSGIGVGPGWNPLFPFPPNGLWNLFQFAPCGWTGGVGIVVMNYTCDIPGTNIQVFFPPVTTIFIFNDPVSCKTGGPNQNLFPDNTIYVGGSAQIAWL